jgi:hypothetical protein
LYSAELAFNLGNSWNFVKKVNRSRDLKGKMGFVILNHWMLLILCLLVGSSNSVITDDEQSKSKLTKFRIPSIDFPQQELRPEMTLSETELQYFRYVLELNGIISFTNIPGFKEARHDCLFALAKCYQERRLRKDQTLSVTLKDGTRRLTIATTNKDTHHQEFTDYGCPEMLVELKKLRSIIDLASSVFARALDDSIAVKEQKPLFMATNNPNRAAYDDFSSLIRHGDHLDHLHLYEKNVFTNQQVVAEDTASEALETHVDHGLFIAIVPSITLKEGKMVQDDDGFEIEVLSSGKLSRVIIPNGGDALVFMIGDGMVNWINKHAVRRPYVVCPIGSFSITKERLLAYGSVVCFSLLQMRSLQMPAVHSIVFDWHLSNPEPMELISWVVVIISIF